MDWSSHHGDTFEGSRVLVTGGAGFIGSHLIEALVALGAEVVALDDLSGGDWGNLRGFERGVEKVTASILDEGELGRAVHGCRYVFHQAALGSVPRSVEEPERFHEVNVTGTLRVLQAARRAGVRRVVFAGSSSAYGDPPGEEPKVETMPPRPKSPYAATKLAGEHDARAWAHSYGLDTASLRYFNIFGPRQNANSAYAAVIAAFARAFARGEAGVIYGDGAQSRDFTHVANAVHANLLAARAEDRLEGEVFNVAVGGRVRIDELYAEMARRWGGAERKPIHKPARPGDVMHSQAAIDKARRVLGYEPIVPFEEGLERTIQWYQRGLKNEVRA